MVIQTPRKASVYAGFFDFYRTDLRQNGKVILWSSSGFRCQWCVTLSALCMSFSKRCRDWFECCLGIARFVGGWLTGVRNRGIAGHLVMLAKGFVGMVERARIEGATRSLGMISQHGRNGGSGSSTMLKQQRDAISCKEEFGILQSHWFNYWTRWCFGVWLPSLSKGWQSWNSVHSNHTVLVQ